MSLRSHTETVVATANVLRTLGREDAGDALAGVLAEEPDLIGLQEWGFSRRRVLPRAAYHWVDPLWGGCALGARIDRYDVIDSRTEALAWFGLCDWGSRPVPVLPPRFATIATLRDRQLNCEVAVVVFHLVAGVQSRGKYRDDHPLLVARHQSELRRLVRIVEAESARGRVVHALGDSNFDGLRLPGLTSAWEGREDEPEGTLGSHRKIDDVHGPGAASSVRLLSNASDHKAVVVRRTDTHC